MIILTVQKYLTDSQKKPLVLQFVAIAPFLSLATRERACHYHPSVLSSLLINLYESCHEPPSIQAKWLQVSAF